MGKLRPIRGRPADGSPTAIRARMVNELDDTVLKYNP
jgi:hypothetical protein